MDPRRGAVCPERRERRIDASDSVSIGEKRKARTQHRTHAEKVFAAPVLVFVFVDTARHSDFACHDGALAVQNLLLAAYALGCGSCYRTSLFPEDLVNSSSSTSGYRRATSSSAPCRSGR